ncbi:GNAT family N-acetyltransferase [Holosporaceae bacterium 'Namur']|nr:GNAT family N-acetyltransferase [Holosporaceae bacterium 'Namur']
MIEFVNVIPNEVEEKMYKDMIKYEYNHDIDVNYKQFSLILTENSNEVVGVLKAYTAFAEVYIDELWVDSSHRGKGYGRKLMQELENHFHCNGFNNINLVTSNFQAPGFYLKCGFTAEFVRINKKHPKLTKTFFIKYFTEELQTQGII